MCQIKSRLLHVNYVKWSPDSSLFASGCQDGTVRIHQLPDGENDLIFSWSGKSEEYWGIYGMDWSPDGRYLALGGSQRMISFFNPKTGVKENIELSYGSKTVESLSFSPDGKLLMAGYQDGHVCIWDIHSAEIIHQFSDNLCQCLTCVAWSPDNVVIASSCHTTSITVRDLRSSKYATELPYRETICVDFSADGRLLAAASLDNRIRIWSGHSWELVAELEQQLSLGIGGLAFHPSERFLATHDEAGKTVNVWNYDPL